jgi:predicted phosphodiesterase
VNLTVKQVKIPIKPNEQYKLFALSDLHIGSNDFNEKSFIKEMDRAYKNCTHIIIIGDVFDAIFSKDKRYQPSVPNSEIASIDDQLNYVLDIAVKLLKPYADKILIISQGNHEYSILKYCNINIMKLLVYRLNSECHTNIELGGYHGFINCSFKINKTHSTRYVIYYHHGYGGNARVSKGMIDINRMRTDFEFDCFLFGHKHSKIADKSERTRCNHYGNIETYTQISSQVGTFKTLIHNSANIGWEDTKGFSASSAGGVTLTIEPESNTEKQGYILRTNLTV